MRANSIIMVVLAAVFGIVAVVLANVWLDGQRSAFASGGGEETPQATIVVAATALNFGDTLNADNLREIAWPANAVPPGTFRTRQELISAEGGRQVLTAMAANEPVLESRITGPGQRATLSAVLAEGMRAVSIRVNDVLGVAGFVLPGDRVDVLLTRNARNNDGDDQPFVDVLLQSIKVLAVDQQADEKRNDPTVVKSVTLEVSTKDAQKLTLASGVGQLSLALRQVASPEGQITDRITLNDLIGDTPADVAARQAELARQQALEEARKRAEADIAGIREAVESVGSRLETRIDTVENELKRVQQPVIREEPEVREVVRLIEAEPPKRVSVNVHRGLDRQAYDVPRLR
ncbi:Flp pilus assembly protein CpaB [Nitratireductor luteus]|uniref:Flp pilus assembly protein CpaB n=1 Tax=Nitratireductor luteus TaxID=2976980 RepID=UPI0022401D4F|nr:Flp pilus assembly protein CpaB [Nitratireductor luteus]